MIGINNSVSFHFIEIDKFDSKFIKFLDSSIVNICEGSSGNKVSNVKQRLRQYFNTKCENAKDAEKVNIINGSVAEFLVHLYLSTLDYKQECLFLNLEERSIKKGFDGYYTYLNKSWVMESKSGHIDSSTITHSSKIYEAYNDLSNKFKGNAVNNPWQNAYNHASHIDVSGSSDLRKYLKKMATDYDNKKFSDIKNYNIIPCSTIYFSGSITHFDKAQIDSIIKSISKFKYKNINVICINKSTVNLFLDYIKK